MKKYIPIFLLAFLFVPQYAFAGLSETCFPGVECDAGDDYYNNLCRPHIESVSGTTPSCVSVNGPAPANKVWAFSCDAGCYLSNSCPGGIIVNGQCLIKLSVLDDNEDVFSVGNGAYKIWDTNELSELVHLPNVGCADGEVAISDDASATGWKCSPTWQFNGSNVYYNSGNIGIGTNTPIGPLHIQTDVDAGPSESAASLVIGNPTGSHLEADSNEIMAKGSATTAATLSLQANGGDLRVNDTTFVVDDSANSVGIGTATPAYTLDVNGQANVDAICINGGTCYTSWSTLVDTYAPNELWSESGSNVYRASGRVGVGTTSPTAKLDVSGATETIAIKAKGLTSGLEAEGNTYGVSGSGSTYGVRGTGSTSAIGYLAYGAYGVYGTGGNYGIYASGASFGVFATSPSYAGYFNGKAYFSGNVGIGVTNPVAKLDVKATGFASGIRGEGIIGVYGGGGGDVGVYGTGNTGVSANGNAMGLWADGDSLGVGAIGGTAGGHFTDANYTSDAYVAYGGYGIDARGDTMGGYFKDQNGTSYANVAYGNGGIEAYGNTWGGYFKDLNGRASLYAGYGSYGLYAYSNTESSTSTYGGYLNAYNSAGATVYGIYANSNAAGSSGASYGIYANASKGSSNYSQAIGVYSKGTDAGGYFEDSNNTGYAYLGYGDYGIQAFGNGYGGYFKDLNSSGYAYIGYNDYGVYSKGNAAGGYFLSNNASGYARVGYGDRGIWAQGNFAGGTFKDADSGTWADIATGSIGLKTNASTVTSSDVRLKKDIHTIGDALGAVENIRGVEFRWKDEKRSGEVNYGFIAQELEPYLPYLVYTDETDGMKYVSYENMTAVLVQALKELKSEKDAEIADLKAAVCGLSPEAELCN